jgi:hypothetical protein
MTAVSPIFACIDGSICIKHPARDASAGSLCARAFWFSAVAISGTVVERKQTASTSSPPLRISARRFKLRTGNYPESIRPNGAQIKEGETTESHVYLGTRSPKNSVPVSFAEGEFAQFFAGRLASLQRGRSAAADEITSLSPSSSKRLGNAAGSRILVQDDSNTWWAWPIGVQAVPGCNLHPGDPMQFMSSSLPATQIQFVYPSTPSYCAF